MYPYRFTEAVSYLGFSSVLGDWKQFRKKILFSPVLYYYNNHRHNTEKYYKKFNR